MFRMGLILACMLVPLAAHPSLATEGDSKLVAYFNCATGERVATAEDVRSGRIQLAASGFCELGQYTNGTYYCRKGSCTGSCQLNNIPVSCSCK